MLSVHLGGKTKVPNTKTTDILSPSAEPQTSCCFALAPRATQSAATRRAVEGRVTPDKARLELKLGNCGLRWVWLKNGRSRSSSQPPRQAHLSCVHLLSAQAGSRQGPGQGQDNSAHWYCSSTLLVSPSRSESSGKATDPETHTLITNTQHGKHVIQGHGGRTARLEVVRKVVSFLLVSLRYN